MLANPTLYARLPFCTMNIITFPEKPEIKKANGIARTEAGALRLSSATLAVMSR
jgi:hypothetical protein